MFSFSEVKLRLYHACYEAPLLDEMSSWGGVSVPLNISVGREDMTRPSHPCVSSAKLKGMSIVSS